MLIFPKREIRLISLLGLAFVVRMRQTNAFGFTNQEPAQGQAVDPSALPSPHCSPARAHLCPPLWCPVSPVRGHFQEPVERDARRCGLASSTEWL